MLGVGWKTIAPSRTRQVEGIMPERMCLVKSNRINFLLKICDGLKGSLTRAAYEAAICLMTKNAHHYYDERQIQHFKF
jgi:hypothetical protein